MGGDTVAIVCALPVRDDGPSLSLVGSRFPTSLAYNAFYFVRVTGVLIWVAARVCQSDLDQIHMQAAELEASKRYFQSLIENASDIIMAAEEILGHHAEEIIGQSLDLLLPLDPRVVQVFLELLAASSIAPLPSPRRISFTQE